MSRWDHIRQTFKPISTDFLALITQRYDLSREGIRRWVRRQQYEIAVDTQRFVPARHGTLGPDLAAAHFVCFRKGRIQFEGSSEWISDYFKVPNKFDSKYKVSAIDASGCNLVYDGLENFIKLDHLESLNVSNSAHLDDWACDRLKRIFRTSTALQTLDLRNCPGITERGIASLCFLNSLEQLLISGTPAASYRHLELLIMLFNDVNPKCKIVT